MNSIWIVLLASSVCLGAAAQPFNLPTANSAIYEPGREDLYFVGTVGKSWTSGTFGCVRSNGQKLHEGIDIKSIKRDKRGEPADPVLAVADGAVVYINSKPSLSTFGKYLVIRHQIEGLEIYSLYAHLSEFRGEVRVGRAVKAGEVVAVMGRTAGTREAISKERAHVHFELNMVVNDRFPSWYKNTFPNQRNDHGAWNGQNMLGLDPRLIFLAQKREGPAFSLLSYVRHQTEMCRVFVRQTQFPWVKRYYSLIRQNPTASKEGMIGYEVALNFNGIPFELIPRAASEIKNRSRFQLLSVNEAEYQKNPARHLVTRQGKRWILTSAGLQDLELLTY